MTFRRPLDRAKKRHDHRRSMWVVCGGAMLWCYRCGAIRSTGLAYKWRKPTGLNGKNPAMVDLQNRGA